MSHLYYHSLAWLTYRLGAAFAIGMPVVLIFWAAIRKESSMIRLLSIYLKTSSLMAISMLLLIGEKPIGYLTSFICPFLMIASVWFWIDLNEELEDLPTWRPLALTVRFWRWSLTWFALLYASLTYLSLPCLTKLDSKYCFSWIEAPQNLHGITKVILNFLLGANWNESLAAFVGYIALIAYLVGFLQWLLIRLPKNGRIAGGF